MKSPTCNYVLQRLTACLLLVVVPWFLWNLFSARNLGYYGMVKTFANPFSVTMMFFMIYSGFFHGYLGVQTICTDYLHNPKIRTAVIFLVSGAFIFLSVLSSFCLVRLVTLGH